MFIFYCLSLLVVVAMYTVNKLLKKKKKNVKLSFCVKLKWQSYFVVIKLNNNKKLGGF